MRTSMTLAENNASRLHHIQRFQHWYGFALLAIFLLINAAVLASSVVMEATRRGGALPFELWEPFVWEYSSTLSILILAPWVYSVIEKNLLVWSNIRQSVAVFFLGAGVFSVAHVGLMVGMRKLVYLFHDGDYVFGDLLFEFLYEFRKDVVTFSLLLLVMGGFRFIVGRLMGEANLIGEDVPPHTEPSLANKNRLLVKKLGKEFIVKLEDVEWMEASGNYVNLHINERIYPVRTTLAALAADVADKGFCRIHRSHMINLDCVDTIASLPSGDGEVTLKSGKVLNLSRRYKDELKQFLL